MIFIKIIGSFMIIGSCIAYSRVIYSRYSKYVYHLKRLQQLLTQITQEMGYTRLPLPELFHQLESLSEDPYCEWLHYLSCESGAHNSIPFYTIWEKSISIYMNTFHMKNIHLQIMNDFGRQLSMIGFEPETNQMNIILQRLTNEITQETDTLKTKQKLCNYFGVMGGLFLVILLF